MCVGVCVGVCVCVCLSFLKEQTNYTAVYASVFSFHVSCKNHHIQRNI